jgi:hypothetical protein|uniref:Uncharacterized protein n=1 Tax=Picea glauca TaxID=3330 RepID=A0A101M3V0_PICGL|nr:hypothetical protein ABT39_MTgene443 [Picea glauca]QHR88200.1 hypothetical protein Q903MT_gene2213 [Picea sitchensis]
MSLFPQKLNKGREPIVCTTLLLVVMKGVDILKVLLLLRCKGGLVVRVGFDT